MKIALSGRSGSGKSIVAHYLRDKHGFAHASSGVICRQIGSILFGNQDKQFLNQISLAIRSFGNDVLIKAALRNESADSIVFDSVRYSSDIAILNSLGFKIWRIECPVEECVRRLKERGQIITEEDLKHPSELELNTANFDTIIHNHNRTKEQLEGEVDVLLQP